MRSSVTDRIQNLARKHGVLRPRDLDQYGIPRRYLSRLYQRGLITRVGRGLYVNTDVDPTEDHSIAQVCKRIPGGVICLLSALRFHHLTTQQSPDVWVAIDRSARRPKVPELPIRIVRFSGAAFTEGIERHKVEGVSVRIYSAAKTVADCFKYRNKLGLDVALEALRECRRDRRCTSEDLWHYAKTCRVANIMRPYLEAMV